MPKQKFPLNFTSLMEPHFQKLKPVNTYEWPPIFWPICYQPTFKGINLSVIVTFTTVTIELEEASSRITQISKDVYEMSLVPYLLPKP